MADLMPHQVLSLTTTVATEDDARRLAQGLLDARLAACVQLDRVESHYHWQGAMQAEAEIRLTVKSVPERQAALQAFLSERHPYELPQVLWHVDEASAAYAAWVKAEVARA
jgi:periplasmic divalent cation tolerance protein